MNAQVNDSGTGRGMSARDDVLAELRAAKGEPVSVWALTMRTGRNQADVRAAIAELAAEDWAIECAALPWWAK